MIIEEEQENLEKLINALKRAKSTLKKVYLEGYKEHLEHPLDEGLDELIIAYEELKYEFQEPL